MLTDAEIERLTTDLESDLVERKETLSGSTKDRMAQAICAYSNDLPNHKSPGLIVIGMNDNGEPTGLAITDELLLELGAIRSDGNILPIPTMVVQRSVVKGRHVAVVIVAPSTDTPVRYEGRVWIRVGPRRAIASRDEERILVEKRQAGDLSFDRRAARGATLDDLDLELFRSTYLPAAVSPDVVAENRRPVRDQLAALHLLAPVGEPNHAALLLLGVDPRAWMSGAYVQFARFDGIDLTAPILDQKELGGRIVDILRRMDELASVNIRVETAVEGSVTERRLPDYPLAALQQLLRNAVLHRTYEVQAPVYWYWFSDRVEIHSPGGLYGRVNESNFGQPGATDYRNQTLAEGLKVTGFVQRFGMGIELARRRCAENGNPPPAFTFSPSAVLATIRRKP
jgi:ATP-dependent DNA helicase RecG